MSQSQTRVAVLLLSIGIVLALAYRLRPAPGPPPSVHTGNDTMMVYVVGAVQKPGVYALAPGCRAVDAVKAAGGLTERANDAGVNLAARMHDGEMLRVPAIGEKVVVVETPASTPEVEESVAPVPDASASTDATAPVVTKTKKKAAAAATDTPSPTATADPGPLPDEARVSLNRASLKELEKVPGMTHGMAHSIVDYRTGPPPHAFTSVEDLKVVTGLDGPPLHALMHYLKL